jgi:NitT/TauT family transport system substrate-binding protein
LKKILIAFIVFSVVLTNSASVMVKVQAAAELTAPRIALANPITPVSLNNEYGPIHLGAELGMPMTKDNYAVFTSTPLAVQALQAGQVDIVYGSVVAMLAAKQAGLDLKIFCPAQRMSDFVLVGRNGIKSLEQLFDAKTRFGGDQPTSPLAVMMSAVLIKNGMNKTESDMPGMKIINANNLKVEAWASNDIDATIFTLSVFNSTLPDVPDGVIITKFYEELPEFTNSVFAASTQWLEAHKQEAAIFCASVFKGGQVLANDFKTFSAAANELMEKAPPDASLQLTFDLLKTKNLWSLNGGFNSEAITYMIDLATKLGLLTETVKAEDILDMSYYEAALKMLPEEYQPTEPEATAEATIAP